VNLDTVIFSKFQIDQRLLNIISHIILTNIHFPFEISLIQSFLNDIHLLKNFLFLSSNKAVQVDRVMGGFEDFLNLMFEKHY